MLSRHCISTNDSQQDCFVCSLLRGNKPKERFDHMEVHRQVWSAWDSLSVVRQTEAGLAGMEISVMEICPLFLASV